MSCAVPRCHKRSGSFLVKRRSSSLSTTCHELSSHLGDITIEDHHYHPISRTRVLSSRPPTMVAILWCYLLFVIFGCSGLIHQAEAFQPSSLPVSDQHLLSQRRRDFGTFPILHMAAGKGFGGGGFGGGGGCKTGREEGGDLGSNTKESRKRKSDKTISIAVSDESSLSSRGGGGGGSGGGGKGMAGMKASSGMKVSSNPDVMLTTMESEIQKAIEQVPGLRDAMNLQEEVRELEQLEKISRGGRNGMRAAAGDESSSLMTQKRGELTTLRESGGWSEKKVHNALHEITWDSSALFRDGRQRETVIPLEMETHMRSVAKWAITVPDTRSGSGGVEVKQQQREQLRICDVGSGTGILLRYIREVTNAADRFAEEYFYGVDLSQKMLDIAASSYPRAKFVHTDFLDYCPPPPPPHHHHPHHHHSAGGWEWEGLCQGEQEQQRQQQPMLLFSSIVFNECLHNFLNIYDALNHANSLLIDGGRIIISHPKGFDNVFLQRSKNRLLVPSLLPTAEELEQLAMKLHMHVEVSPKVKTTKYFAVLTKKH